MPSPINLRHTTTALLAIALLAGCAGREPDSTTPEEQPQVEQPITQTEQDQLRQQAQRGDLESQFQLGSSYFVGQPEKNLKQAEYWWKQAADKGHAMAAVSLAYLYTGRDAPEFANQRDMLKYLNQSAAAGNPMCSMCWATSTAVAKAACRVILTRPSACTRVLASRATSPPARRWVVSDPNGSGSGLQIEQRFAACHIARR